MLPHLFYLCVVSLLSLGQGDRVTLRYSHNDVQKNIVCFQGQGAGHSQEKTASQKGLINTTIYPLLEQVRWGRKKDEVCSNWQWILLMGHSKSEAGWGLDWNTTNSTLKDIIPLYSRLSIIYVISDEIIWTANKIIRNCSDLCWTIKHIQNFFLQMLHTCLFWWWGLPLFLGLQLDITGDMKHNLYGSKVCLMIFWGKKILFSFWWMSAISPTSATIKNTVSVTCLPL